MLNVETHRYAVLLVERRHDLLLIKKNLTNILVFSSKKTTFASPLQRMRPLGIKVTGCSAVR
jgi:hypothetical protein